MSNAGGIFWFLIYKLTLTKHQLIATTEQIKLLINLDRIDDLTDLIQVGFLLLTASALGFFPI